MVLNLQDKAEFVNFPEIIPIQRNFFKDMLTCTSLFYVDLSIMHFKCTSASTYKRDLLAVAWKSAVRLKSNCATSIYQTSCFYGVYCDYFCTSV